MHKVLGAIDLLGNPAMVVKHISHGVNSGIKEVRRGVVSKHAPTTALSVGRCGLHVLTGCCSGLFDFSTRCFGSWYGITDMVARNTGKVELSTFRTKQLAALSFPTILRTS